MTPKKKLALIAMGVLLFLLPTLFPTMMLPIMVGSMLGTAEQQSTSGNGTDCEDGTVVASDSSSDDAQAVQVSDDGGDAMKEFFTKYAEIAYDVGKEFGLPWEAIMGQAIEESGWGKSSLAVNNHNFFGMTKVGGGWLSFDNDKEGWEGYGHFLTDDDINGLYKNVVKHHADPQAFIKAMDSSNYCETDNEGNSCKGQYYTKIWGHTQRVIKYNSDHQLFSPSSEANKDFKDKTEDKEDKTGGSLYEVTDSLVSQASCKIGDSEGRSDIIKKYTEWAVQTANDDSIGYSQLRRYLNPDVDCSSFVYYALTQGGGFDGTIPEAFNTQGEGAKLKAWGFEKHPKGVALQEGDILLNPGTHTEIMLSPVSQVGAHHDENNGICAGGECKPGDQTKTEVSIELSTNAWKDYTEVWRLPDSFSRYTSNGSVGSDGMPNGTGNYGWMCSALGICKNGDYGPVGNISGDYQCVWYAWTRLYMIHRTSKGQTPEAIHCNGGHGDGGYIADNLEHLGGWEVSSVPEPGDGVSLRWSDAGGSWQHVAVVEAVDGDNITISEGNYGNRGDWNGFNRRVIHAKDFTVCKFFRHKDWK